MIDWHKRRDTSGVSMLLAAASELGISKSDCLASTKINPDELENPLAHIFVWQEMALIRNVQSLRQSDEMLGLMVSKRCTVPTMGMFGQALATSQKLQDAWQLMEHYQMLGLAFSRFEFSSNRSGLSLTLHDAEMPLDCQRFCEERGLGGCLILFSDLVKQPLRAKSVAMRLPAPSTADNYHEFFGVEVEFNAPRTKICFDKAIETSPLPNANRKLHLASLRYCDEVIRSHEQTSNYAHQVRNILAAQDISTSLEAVANQLNISSRQLRRHLTQESTSFRDIQLTLKINRATALLDAGMSVNQVAHELGYTSQASFSRSYKKITGHSPSQRRL